MEKGRDVCIGVGVVRQRVLAVTSWLLFPCLHAQISVKKDCVRNFSNYAVSQYNGLYTPH